MSIETGGKFQIADTTLLRTSADDIGVLLRAFLPSTAASHREAIRNYSGNAVVLDTRVSCHRPSFSNASHILEQINKAALPGLWGNVAGRVTTVHDEDGRAVGCFCRRAISADCGRICRCVISGVDSSVRGGCDCGAVCQEDAIDPARQLLGKYFPAGGAGDGRPAEEQRIHDGWGGEEWVEEDGKGYKGQD